MKRRLETQRQATSAQKAISRQKAQTAQTKRGIKISG